jgi:putative membrane protein
MNKVASFKPMSFEVEDSNTNIQEQVIAKSDTVDDSNISTNKLKKELTQQENKILKIFQTQYSSFLFIFSIFGLIFISIIVNLTFDALNIYSLNSILGIIYSTMWLIVIYYVSTFFYSQYVQYSSLKKVTVFQKNSIELNQNPTEETFKFVQSVLHQYKNDEDIIIRKKIENTKNKISENKLPKEVVIPVVSEDILSHLDERAEQIIFKFAKENALITAISPIAFLDLIIIFWRNMKMINEIAQVYGFKAGLTGNLILAKRIFEQTIFIGVAELTENALTTITGQAFLSKLSSSVAQGVGHGILTIRVGVSAINSCRPIADLNRVTIFEKLFNELKKTLNPFKK